MLSHLELGVSHNLPVMADMPLAWFVEPAGSRLCCPAWLWAWLTRWLLLKVLMGMPLIIPDGPEAATYPGAVLGCYSGGISDPGRHVR